MAEGVDRVKLNATATASFRLFQKPRKKNSAAHWRMPDGAVFSGMAKLRLRELRKEAKVTQVDLAAALRIEQSHVSRLENDENERVEVELLIEICQLFSWILGKRVAMDELLPVPERSRPRREWKGLVTWRDGVDVERE